MHLNLEITREEAGKFEGTVARDSAAPVAFCGTLELLKVLDDVVDQASGAAESAS